MSRDRVLWAAVAFSLVFHLSMITLFRIVIYFPRNDVEYFTFEIVEAASEPAAPATGMEKLELEAPSPGDALQRVQAQRKEEAANTRLSGLPPIELPKLEFAELDLLRARQEGLEIRSRYDELFESGPRDTWARFGRGISSVGDVLSRVAGGALDGDEDKEPERMPVSRPAPGFEAYLEWLSEPFDRQTLSVSKIEALWGRAPSVLEEPIVLVFRVNRDGRVVYVLPQVEDEEGIVEGAVRALFQYRFEPLEGEGPRTQHGTLVIKGEERSP